MNSELTHHRQKARRGAAECCKLSSVARGKADSGAGERGRGAAAPGRFALRCPRCESLRIQLGFSDPPLHLRLLGIRDLLCNNCNLEFRGFALPGRVKRGRSDQPDDTRNRRRAPRFQVRLPLQVRQIVRGYFGGEAVYSPIVNGHTRDISKIGIAIVLPTAGAEAYDFSDTEKRLQVWVGLPTGTVLMKVAPVRREDGRGTSRVIGAQIGSMSEDDRAAFHRYIETLG